MIGIVGGGITGLALGQALGARGVEARVFEAEERPGGVLWTEDVDGVPIELGAQRTRLTPEVASLVERLGLLPELLVAERGLPLFVYREGRLRRVPFTFRQAWKTDLLSAWGKLRVLREPFVGPPRRTDSAADWLRRAFGDEAYRTFVGPLYGGLYASDPARMPARHGLARTLRAFAGEGSVVGAMLRRRLSGPPLPPPVSFRKGMRRLPEALGEELGPRLVLGSPVESIAPEGSGSHRRWVVETEKDVLRVSRVVLTLPADGAAALLAASAPETSRRLRSLRYNPLAVVYLRSQAEVHGLGYQVGFGERLETRGVTWNESLFGRGGLSTAYLGGMQHPDVVDWSDERLGSVAADEFRRVTGWEARPIAVHRTRVPAWDETWHALEGLRLPSGVFLCASYESRPGIPGRLREAKGLARRLAHQPEERAGKP